MTTMTVPAELDNLDEVIDFINGELEANDCPMKTQIQIDIAVEEIFVNIAHYAYPSQINDAVVGCSFEENPRAVKISFIDTGTPYNPLEKEDPDVTLSVEERQVGGLGIYMVKKSMDEVSYEHNDGHNIFHIKKFF